MLKQHIARGSLRHAYLFCGPPGLGRRTLALRLAQALNCTTPPAPGEACGKCRDCKVTLAMQHPDLSIVQAEAEGGTLKVEQVRSLRQSLALKPYQARYRVALLLRFQEANASAANALLKTLEEAPAYAVLALTADNPEQLLPTIVSRCEVLRLRPLPLEEAVSALQARGMDEARARLLAHISGGRPGFALRLDESPELLEKRTERLNDLHRMLASSRVERFAYAEALAKDKESLRQALLFWLSYWRDVMLRASGAQTPPANVDRRAEIEHLAARFSLEMCRGITAGLEKSIGQLDANVNARLLAEALLLDWPRM
jgi:DNA polymerase-3 subunit delta'